MVAKTRLERLRDRLLEMWLFFQDSRLVPAQNVWKDDQQAFWQRVYAMEEAVLEFTPLPAMEEAARARAPDLLVELAAVDRAASGAAGTQAPFTEYDEYWLVHRHRPKRSQDAAQTGRIAAYIQHHAVIPKVVRVDQTQIRIRVRRANSAADPLSQIVVETMSFADGGHLIPSKPNWRGVAQGITVERTEAIRQAINVAASSGVDVLVFPELTILPAHRAHAVRHLQARLSDPWCRNPALTVLGSFHESISGKVYNTTLLVNQRGEAIGFEGDPRDPWCHISHRKFSPLGHGDTYADAEAIDVGDELCLYVTPLGLVAVAICKDYLDHRFDGYGERSQPTSCSCPRTVRG